MALIGAAAAAGAGVGLVLGWGGVHLLAPRIARRIAQGSPPRRRLR